MLDTREVCWLVYTTNLRGTQKPVLHSDSGGGTYLLFETWVNRMLNHMLALEDGSRQQ